MSRKHRKQGLWPADDVTQTVWHLVGALEDTVDLFQASKATTSTETSVALIKKALVEFVSFNDLVGEFAAVTAKADISEESRTVLRDALRKYNRTLEPSRQLLTTIRNTIAAHRTGQPGPSEQKKHGMTFEAWGAWERRMLDLEAECTRERWVDVFNAAIELNNAIAQLALGSWFSADGESITFYHPLRFE